MADSINSREVFGDLKGIYKIVCKPTNKTYWGSTVCFADRFRSHRNNLLGNRHENAHLQNAWNKYGKVNFSFEVLEILQGDKVDLFKREQTYLDNACNTDFNINTTAKGIPLAYSKKICEEIINKYLETKCTQEQLAKEFNSSRCTMSLIINGKYDNTKYIDQAIIEKSQDLCKKQSQLSYDPKKRSPSLEEGGMVKWLLSQGVRPVQIEPYVNMGLAVIYNISAGRSYRKVSKIACPELLVKCGFSLEKDNS